MQALFAGSMHRRSVDNRRDMSARREKARLEFIDDELMRLPMVAEQVFDATWRSLTDGVPAMALHERGIAAELLQVGPPHRGRMVERFVDSVRRQVRAGLAGVAPLAAPAAPGGTSGGLSLLDENEIAADVETSHAIEAIRSTAEHELREMATYASALAGDPDVSRDHNPFRAETYAQALWEAVQALPLGRAYQTRLMRHAAQPLAQVLRKSYAGACSRLESQGIEPAAYRTLILPGGKRSSRPADSWQGEGSPTLHMLRATMPAPLDPSQNPATSQVPLERVIEDADAALRALPADAPPTVRAQLLESQRARLVRHASSPVDQQVIEMLSRLFEAMLSDPRIARDIRSVLARLQPSALRLVLRDDTALDDYTHPVWRFMDVTAHQAALFAEGDPEREALLQLAEQLIDAMAREPVPDAPLYRRGLDRLFVEERARFEVRVRRAGPAIEELQHKEDRLAGTTACGPPTGAGPLDEGQLDTVPADLLDKLPVAADGQRHSGEEWLRQRRPGEWLRIFIRGQWQSVQLLAVGRHGEAYLFGRGQGDETVALRRGALLRLRVEGLLKVLRVRSMLRSAAVQVLRNAQQG
jgi:hypothetical protein